MMTSATAVRPHDWQEGRRLRAWELKQQGWTQRLIAAALGVTPGAVSQWMTRVREDGVAGLRRRIATGPQPKLGAEQRAELPVLLARGARTWGFHEEVWTNRRIAVVIEQASGVRYHPSHVSRLLRAIGWSPQKPSCEPPSATRRPSRPGISGAGRCSNGGATHGSDHHLGR